ncbi:HNH endonuclease [Rhizobium leguminosarum]|uniref:HNH endonuclease n=1 Tax=Rhizobium leguminosarum TaxID=384 RepID=UPI0013EF3965|nr:HNH endonuclease signature motif containing protein [Rhizobium leguminosarum]
MKVLQQYGARCMCCGSTPEHKTVGGEPVAIVVDHIKPLSKYWDLRLERGNLQVLCQECNQGKGAWDETDYRPVPKTDEGDTVQ